MKVKRRKRISLQRGRPTPATGANQNWSMDFVHDQMPGGRAFRVLTVIRAVESPEVCFWRPNSGSRGGGLERLWTRQRWSEVGPKQSQWTTARNSRPRRLGVWAWRRGVKLNCTRPGKPTDKGLIESFNGRLRDEFLNVNEFITVQDAREKLKAWQHDCNHHRPHGSLGHLTPRKFVKKRSDQQPESGPTPV